MSTENNNINFQETKPFIKELKSLQKRFRYVADDVLYAWKCDVEINGQYGKCIANNNNWSIHKLRTKNTFAKKGKSGGFRVIYSLNKAKTIANLIFIYSKTDKENISEAEIMELLEKYNIDY